METLFDNLKQHFGTHKKAAAAIGLSYSRYNDFRYGEKIPEKTQVYINDKVRRLKLRLNGKTQ